MHGLRNLFRFCPEQVRESSPLDPSLIRAYKKLDQLTADSDGFVKVTLVNDALRSGLQLRYRQSVFWRLVVLQKRPATIGGSQVPRPRFELGTP